MDYEVDFGILERSGQRAGMVAQDARQPLAAMRIDGVGAAIPGGLSGAVADGVDRAWRAAASEIGSGLDGYASALTATAANYRQAEQQAAEATRAFFGSAG